jgi:hypothetical protein
MGNEIFGIDVAGIVADAIGDGVFDVTIERYVRGDREAGNLTGGRPAEPEEVQCKGFWDDFTGLAPPGIVVETNDRKAVLIGDTIPAGGHPRLNDKITVHEDGGDISLFCVGPISRDPAAAVFVYQCRDRIGPDQA